jgi:hypothetical protein
VNRSEGGEEPPRARGEKQAKRKRPRARDPLPKVSPKNGKLKSLITVSNAVLRMQLCKKLMVLVQREKGLRGVVMSKVDRARGEGVWCEYVGGGRYDGDLICLPFDAELMTANRIVLIPSKDGSGNQERILRECYEHSGRTRQCPKRGVVHLYRFTEAVLDEFNGEEQWNPEEDEFGDEDQDQGGCCA